MKTTIKKITTPIIALFLVFACIFQLPTVSGKYTSTFNNLVGYISFSGSALADMFYITKEEASKNLYGYSEINTDTNPITIKNPVDNGVDDDFDINKGIVTAFPAINASGKTMIIGFRVRVCLPNCELASIDNKTMPFKITGTKVDGTTSELTGTFYISGDYTTYDYIRLLKRNEINDTTDPFSSFLEDPFKVTTSTAPVEYIEDYGIGFIKQDNVPYYLYTGHINTNNWVNNNAISTTNNAFILEDGDSVTYTIDIDFAGIESAVSGLANVSDSIYTSIEIVAMEYNG